MKVFLAINIPDPVQKNIESQITVFKKDYLQMAWVPPHNFHITTFYFGEVDDIDRIKKTIEEAVYDIPAFTMFSLHTDLFMTNKITLYLAFQRIKKLEHVFERISESYTNNQPTHTTQKSTQKFLPHLTLARYKIPSKQQYLLIKKKIQNLPIDIEFKVTKLYLYESVLKGEIPQYKELAEFFLLDE